VIREILAGTTPRLRAIYMRTADGYEEARG